MDTLVSTFNRLIAADQQVTLFLNGSDSLFLDGVAKCATMTLTWLPLAVVLLYVLIRNNNMRTVVALLVCIALCILLSDQMASGICKPYFERFRPAQDPQLMYMVDVVNGYRGGKFGFFSSHASNTFSVAVFVSLLIRNRSLSLGLVSWALLNCWTRIYLGVHYFGDLLVGTIWGCLVGSFVYWGYVRLFHVDYSNIHQSELQTRTGYACVHATTLLVALLLTYLYVLVYAVCFSVFC